MISDDV